MEVVIREEREGDREAVYAVEAAAFARTDEAELVEKLKQADIALISLVAEAEGQIVGHIVFSPVTVVEENGRSPAIALGPLAVLPEFQNQGVGSHLTRAGLAACREAGQVVVFVLGHADYYPRFGFEVTRPYHIACEFDVPDEVFMVAELYLGALADVAGIVHYHQVFKGV